MFTLAFFNSIGPMELIVLLVLGILIFGKKLPDIGRNVGKSIVEFKKGLAGVEEDVNTAANAPRGGNVAPPPQQYQQPAAYQQNQQPPQQLTGQGQQPSAHTHQQAPAEQNNRQA